MEKEFTKKAVSLKYNNKENQAPIVTSYGKNKNAQQIIKIAKQNDIPIKKDEDLVNMLSEIELNKEIPTQLYQVVSELFSFIYNIANEKEKSEKKD
ncbi:MAG: EscU/YscU/HrcU family type III secretion system export apparatus switch protein [Campylobacterota bacterium]|nr:EscU/YscU/HrcU family type III secretion system export apparatus switch protein [Campylobacterota bacterium]